MTYTLDELSASTSTPKDYHRIHFDPSALPSKRIVGLLACQRDPLLRRLMTRVVSVKPASLSAVPLPKGKEKKKKSAASTPAASGSATPIQNGSGSGSGADTPVVPPEPVGKLWEVELEDTVIFPEGGGQPFDTGRLSIDQGGEKKKSWMVEGCIRRKLDSVHLVRAAEGDTGALEDLQGKEVEVEVDWDRRMDHMALHTSQHLLSAVLDTFAEGLPTLSWSLSAYPSIEAPYIELARGLTWAEVAQVEKRCNDLIAEDRRIWVDVDMQEEGFVKMTAAGYRENRGIPQDYTDGVIRHINIDGIDRNACCGTQLPNLSHLSFIHVLPPSTAINSDKTSKAATKIYFVSGPRAISFLQQSSRTLSEASQVLGVPRLDVPQKAVKTDELRKESLSREKDLRIELAKVVGEAAVASPDNAKGLYWIHRTEKSSHDFEFLGMVAAGMLASQPPAGDLEGPVVVISSAVQGVTPSLLQVNSPAADLAKKVNERIKQALEGPEGKGRVKGGGAKGRFMCKIDGKFTKADLEKLQGVVADIRAGRID